MSFVIGGKPSKEERFIKTLEQKAGFGGVMEIWVDKETGVNYLYRVNGYAGGLTPLLDAQGKPVITLIAP